MAKEPNWTYEELERLKQSYTYFCEHKEEAKLIFGRTWNGIKLKASRLGIKKDFSVLLEERFYSKINKNGIVLLENSPCWEWIADKDNRGYGHFWKGGETVYAHRVAYELAHGDIPDGLLICHICNNPSCCNPDHLYLGTGSDNIKQAVNEGRLVTIKGERHTNAKLSDEEVIKIRNLLEDGCSQSQISELFGICQQHVSKINTNKRRAYG